MIDSVKLEITKKLDEKLFVENGFEHYITSRTGSPCYFKELERITIQYFTESEKLIIKGRIIYLYKKDIGRVKNFDDIMLEEKIPFYSIINTIEKNLVNIFFPNNNTDITLNLITSNVTYIEYCINLDVGSKQKVESYIKMMNLIFIDKDDKRYINYTIDKGEELFTSCYIKSEGAYNKNKKGKANTVINFYNKLDQLSGSDFRGWTEESKQVHKKSEVEAENILRLEVQLDCQALYNFRTKYKIPNLLCRYASLDIAYDFISKKYEWFFGKGDLYTYAKLKEIINSSSLSEKVKENILAAYRKYNKIIGQEYTDRKKYPNKLSVNNKNKVKALKINPVLIPRKFNVSYLDSPTKLLMIKLEQLNNLGIIHEEKQDDSYIMSLL